MSWFDSFKSESDDVVYDRMVSNFRRPDYDTSTMTAQEKLVFRDRILYDDQFRNLELVEELCRINRSFKYLILSKLYRVKCHHLKWFKKWWSMDPKMDVSDAQKMFTDNNVWIPDPSQRLWMQFLVSQGAIDTNKSLDTIYVNEDE